MGGLFGGLQPVFQQQLCEFRRRLEATHSDKKPRAVPLSVATYTRVGSGPGATRVVRQKRHVPSQLTCISKTVCAGRKDNSSDTSAAPLAGADILDCKAARPLDRRS